MALRDVARFLGRFEFLDPVSDWLSARVYDVAGTGPVRDALSGRWLGHPLHPMLTDVPIGAWVAACVLDIVGGEEQADAADALIALGILSAAPTAAAGLSDWSDTVGEDRRIGLVHAAANTAALVFYSTSLVLRRAGARRSGVALSWLGGGAVTFGGYLGGHLSYSRGIGVDHNVFEEPPEGWVRVASEEQLEEGKPVLGEANGYGVLLYRREGVVHAIADRCSHAGGPLHEGSVDDDLCVTCPWHASMFRLADGQVARGPATAPQPVFDVRLREGAVEVALKPAS
ncbi:MAG TPA: Rieske 2Fe-2S domain-containing protein [Candidatus Sulfotelmatobacter sp.]|nr:Rieske 2Fe-2S domain-containing protein [Candidatus Sulfotelmatobacter sp.]